MEQELALNRITNDGQQQQRPIERQLAVRRIRQRDEGRGHTEINEAGPEREASSIGGQARLRLRAALDFGTLVAPRGKRHERGAEDENADRNKVMHREYHDHRDKHRDKNALLDGDGSDIAHDGEEENNDSFL